MTLHVKEAARHVALMTIDNQPKRNAIIARGDGRTGRGLGEAWGIGGLPMHRHHRSRRQGLLLGRRHRRRSFGIVRKRRG